MATRFDIKLTESGEIDLTNLKPGIVSGSDYVKQKLKIILDYYFGEWFLNTADGTKWKEKVLKKQYNNFDIERHLRERIRSVKEVFRIVKFNMDFSEVPTDRKLKINFTVTTREGEQITILKEVGI